MQLVTEVPLLEDSLLRIHLLGLSPDIPLSCDQALDMIEKLVHKAAVLASSNLLLNFYFYSINIC